MTQVRSELLHLTPQRREELLHRGRPRGSPDTLRLTPEVTAEIKRRVRLRIANTSKAIARDYGVSESTIVSAIKRLRGKGWL